MSNYLARLTGTTILVCAAGAATAQEELNALVWCDHTDPALIDPVLAKLVEAGADIAASLLADDLVDRLEIYRAPIVIGGGRGAVSNFGLAALDDTHGRWALVERRQLGSDSFEAYSRQRQE